MADRIRVLIVEDDEATLADWSRAVERHNAEEERHKYRLVAEFARTLIEAEDFISARKYDAAVIDLRLRARNGGQGHNADGNRVARLLAETAVAAIAIYTGQPGEAELLEASPQMSVFPKGEGLDPVIDWLRS